MHSAAVRGHASKKATTSGYEPLSQFLKDLRKKCGDDDLAIMRGSPEPRVEAFSLPPIT